MLGAPPHSSARLMPPYGARMATTGEVADGTRRLSLTRGSRAGREGRGALMVALGCVALWPVRSSAFVFNLPFAQVSQNSAILQTQPHAVASWRQRNAAAAASAGDRDHWRWRSSSCCTGRYRVALSAASEDSGSSPPKSEKVCVRTPKYFLHT